MRPDNMSPPSPSNILQKKITNHKYIIKPQNNIVKPPLAQYTELVMTSRQITKLIDFDHELPVYNSRVNDQRLAVATGVLGNSSLIVYFNSPIEVANKQHLFCHFHCIY